MSTLQRLNAFSSSNGFSKVNVLIGPNNSGKSLFLKGLHPSLLYESQHINLDEIRKPQPIVNYNGVWTGSVPQFVNALHWNNSNYAYIKKLKELMHNLNHVCTTVMENKVCFKLSLDGKQFSQSELSDGTLRAMLLTWLLFSPDNKFDLLAIDDVEAGLHPAWQKVVGRWIQQSTIFDQCFVSTHSSDFLDTFTEGFKRGNVSIFVFDHGEVKQLDYSSMKDELEDWELGDLYRVNDPAIGGWPW